MSNAYNFYQQPCGQQTPQYAYINTLQHSSNTNYYNNYNYLYNCRTQTFFTTTSPINTENSIYSNKIKTVDNRSTDTSCYNNIDSVISNSCNTPCYYNYPSCSQLTNNDFVAREFDYSIAEQFYSQPFEDINQTADDSESDIVVEDSSNDSYDLQHFLSTNCCVCNVPYTSFENQFHVLTNKTPFTMSSQHPVYFKLQETLGLIGNKTGNICSNCLGLVNTIDRLQVELQKSKSKLLDIYHQVSSCKRRPKFKNLCGLHRFKCKFCKKKFTLHDLFKIHIAKHKLQKHKRFLCEVCGKRFMFMYSLKLHVLLHKPKIDAYICRLCEKPFRTRSNLKEHYSNCSNIYPYTCCGKKFSTSSRLKSHRKLKHDKKFVAICSICNIGFVKLSDYKSHKLTHTTEKKFECSQCGKTYKTASNLNFHKKVHLDKLPFSCTICNKEFMRKEYLEAHINNHNGLKKYTCQVCSKKFVSQKGLDAHFKYHDGTVKKHNCNICNKVITSGFEEHLRTHSKLKEFQCDVCLIKFNTKGALSKHKLKKHMISRL